MSKLNKIQRGFSLEFFSAIQSKLNVKLNTLIYRHIIISFKSADHHLGFGSHEASLNSNNYTLLYITGASMPTFYYKTHASL